MHNEPEDGGSTRLFKVIDDFNREALDFEVDLSLPAGGCNPQPRIVHCLVRYAFCDSSR